VSDDSSDLSLAIRECMQLFLQNFTANPVETTLRIRALQDLSQGMDTDLLMLLAKATSRAKAAGELEDGLRGLLGGAGAGAGGDEAA
jgi:hypothetical protein